MQSTGRERAESIPAQCTMCVDLRGQKQIAWIRLSVMRAQHGVLRGKSKAYAVHAASSIVSREYWSIPTAATVFNIVPLFSIEPAPVDR